MAKLKMVIDGRHNPPIPAKADIQATLTAMVDRGVTSVTIEFDVANDARVTAGGVGTASGADGIEARILAFVGILFPAVAVTVGGVRKVRIELPGEFIQDAETAGTNENLIFKAIWNLGNWASCGNCRMSSWFTPSETDADGNEIGNQSITAPDLAAALGFNPARREEISAAALAAGYSTLPRWNAAGLLSGSITNVVLGLVRQNQAWAGRPSARASYRIGDALADQGFGRPMIALYVAVLRKMGREPRKGGLVQFCQEITGELP